MIATLALLAATAPAAPPIHHDPVPFGADRKRQMRAYARRHYGIDDFRLKAPKVIVQHVTVSSTYSSVFNTFASNAPDPELRERPGVCTHFVIDRRGTIHRLVSLKLMCRHTVGLNYTSIGIEHVGRNDAEVISNARQMSASLRLTRWLQSRYGIATRNVIGHSESLPSPYHRERVERLRRQTHGDWSHRNMVSYRKRLRGTT